MKDVTEAHDLELRATKERGRKIVERDQRIQRRQERYARHRLSWLGPITIGVFLGLFFLAVLWSYGL